MNSHGAKHMVPYSGTSNGMNVAHGGSFLSGGNPMTAMAPVDSSHTEDVGTSIGSNTATAADENTATAVDEKPRVTVHGFRPGCPTAKKLQMYFERELLNLLQGRCSRTGMPVGSNHGGGGGGCGHHHCGCCSHHRLEDGSGYHGGTTSGPPPVLQNSLSSGQPQGHPGGQVIAEYDIYLNIPSMDAQQSHPPPSTDLSDKLEIARMRKALADGFLIDAKLKYENMQYSEMVKELKATIEEKDKEIEKLKGSSNDDGLSTKNDQGERMEELENAMKFMMDIVSGVTSDADVESSNENKGESSKAARGKSKGKGKAKKKRPSASLAMEVDK